MKMRLRRKGGVSARCQVGDLTCGKTDKFCTRRGGSTKGEGVPVDILSVAMIH